MGSNNFNTSGANTWTCPATVAANTQVTIEVWGAGGGGGGSNNNATAGGAGGGGGAAYSRVVVTGLVTGNVYSLYVAPGGAGGTGNANGTAGAASYFNNNSSGNTSTIVGANGGGGGIRGNNTGNKAGVGGAENISGGVTSYVGGNGANNGGTNTGGGGAAAAGNSNVGADLGNTTQTGGTGENGGGNGGTGGSRNQNGNNGVAPGGAGGGGGRSNATTGTNRVGGTGGIGRILLSWTDYEPPPDPMSMSTEAATDISGDLATGNGTIVSLGDGGNADSRGFVYEDSPQGDPGDIAPESSTYRWHVEESGTYGAVPYSLILTGLPSQHAIYYRSFAHNSVGYKYGEEETFTTLSLESWDVNKGSDYFLGWTTSPTKDAAYKIQVTSSPTKTAAYRVQTVQSPTKTAAYKIQPSQSPTKTAAYRIPTTQSPTKTAAYRIPTTQSPTKTAAYRIPTTQSPTKTAAYRIPTTQSPTKTAAYRIPTTQSPTKTAAYRIPTTQSPTKAAEYRIVASTYSPTKDAAYRIQSTQSPTKTAEYEITSEQTYSPTLKSTYSLVSSGEVQDNFNRQDADDLGPNWIPTLDIAKTLSIQSNQAAGLNSGEQDAVWTVNTFPENQFSEITFGTLPTEIGWLAAWVRRPITGDPGGYLILYWASDGQFRLYSRAGDGWHNLANVAGGTVSSGDTLTISATSIGSGPVSLVIRHNGVVVLTHLDETFLYRGGAPGVGINGSSGTIPSIESWRAGGGFGGYPFATNKTTDENGVDSYDNASQYNGPALTTLRVLVPDNPSGLPHRFIYALSVEAGLGQTWGDGLEELRTLGVHNTYNATIIAPSFEVDPCFVDHPTYAGRRYESYMVQELIPWVEANLASSGTEQHWMVGFSKSGTGGATLLMRNPTAFDRAAVWDLPADADFTGNESWMAPNYGTEENYDNNYRLSAGFINTYKTPFLSAKRLWVGWYEGDAWDTEGEAFADNLQAANVLLTESHVQHYEHSWTSGWLAGAIQGLYELGLQTYSPTKDAAYRIPTTQSPTKTATYVVGGIQQVGSILTFSNIYPDNAGTVATDITVPDDAELIVVGATGYRFVINPFTGGKMQFTKGGIDTDMVTVPHEDSNNAAYYVGMFYLVSPDTGADKTLKWDWEGTGGMSDATVVSVTFWKGIDTASPVRFSGGAQSVNLPYITETLTAQSGDLILALVGAYSGSPGPTVDSWTNLTFLGAGSNSSPAWQYWATGSPSGNVAVSADTDTGLDDGGIVAIVLKPASGEATYSPTKTAAYVVQTTQSPTKTATYRIPITQSPTKDTTYRVQAGISPTKGATYGVLTSQSPTKDAAYEVAWYVRLKATANLTDGNATTRQLSYPGSKGSGDFEAGKQVDTTNPQASFDPGTDKFSEWEASIELQSALVADGDVIEIRLSNAGVDLTSYTNVASWTIQIGATTYSPTKGALYKILATLSPTKDTLYKTLATLAQTKDAVYRLVAATVSPTKEAIYRILTMLSPTKEAVYRLVAAIFSPTKQAIYRVLTSPVPTKEAIYRLIAATLSPTKEAIYRLLTVLSPTKDALYKVLATFSPTKTAEYQIAGISVVSITKDAIYRLLTVLSPTKTAAYRLLAAILSPTKEAIYRVLTSSVPTRAAVYRLIAATLSPTKEAIYKLLPSLSPTKNALYKVLATFSPTKSAAYQVAGVSVVSITKDAAYRLLTVLSPTKAAVYRLVANVLSPTKTALYKILPTLSPTKTAVYRIRAAVVSPTKDVAYRVLTALSPTKTAAYLVQLVKAVTKSSTYNILGQGTTTWSPTKTAQYIIILAGQTVTRSAAYRILVGVWSPTKTALYKLLTVSSPTKGATYRLRFSNLGSPLATAYQVIRQNLAATKQAVYQLLNVKSPTRATKYTVLTQQQPTKTAAYRIVTHAELAEQTQYKVEATRDTLKAGTYRLIPVYSKTLAASYALTGELFPTIRLDAILKDTARVAAPLSDSELYSAPLADTLRLKADLFEEP